MVVLLINPNEWYCGEIWHILGSLFSEIVFGGISFYSIEFEVELTHELMRHD